MNSWKANDSVVSGQAAAMQDQDQVQNFLQQMQNRMHNDLKEAFDAYCVDSQKRQAAKVTGIDWASMVPSPGEIAAIAEQIRDESRAAAVEVTVGVNHESRDRTVEVAVCVKYRALNHKSKLRAHSHVSQISSSDLTAGFLGSNNYARGVIKAIICDSQQVLAGLIFLDRMEEELDSLAALKEAQAPSQPQ